MSAPTTPADRHNLVVEVIMNLFESDLLDRFAGLPVEQKVGAIFAGIRKFLPDVTDEEIGKAFLDAEQRIDEEMAVRTTTLDAEINLSRRLIALGEGLPEEMTMGDVVKLRAEEGNEFAQWVLRNPHVLEREITIPAGGDDE